MSTKKLQEKVSVGGGATGVSEVPVPADKSATLPASKLGNGEPMQKIDDPNNPGVEDTSTENNIKATGDKAGANKASVAMKPSSASATQSYSFTPNAVKEDLAVMFSGEELTEEFKEKATAIFEAAVSMRVAEQVSAFETQVEEMVAEQVDAFQQAIAQKVEDHMNYVVEQWLEENQVAIETSLRTELTNDFMSGIKKVFEDNYIDIPEDKVDVLGDMAAKLDEMTEKLNSVINENIELKTTVAEATRAKILSDVCEGLAATQVEKLTTLAEGVDFDSPNSFRKKLEIVKENYFPSSKPAAASLAEETMLNEETEGEKPEVTGTMANYVRAISKTLKK